MRDERLRKKRSGFSRVEVAVFFGIIFVLVLLALPNVRSSRLKANHEIAASNLLTIVAANSLYFEKYKQYAPHFMALYPDQFLVSQKLLQATNTENSHDGYHYAYNVQENFQTFLAFAIPAEYGSSGLYTFVINELEKVFQRDMHQGRSWTPADLKERFVDYDYSIPGKHSPWKPVVRGRKLVLGNLEGETWDISNFDRKAIQKDKE